MSNQTPLPVFMRLIEAGDALDRGEQATARHELEEILAGQPPADSVERLAAVFAQAMLARLQGDLAGVGNLYERVGSPGDMLSAFHVLAQATPIVRFGHEAANLMLMEALGAGAPLPFRSRLVESMLHYAMVFDALDGNLEHHPAERLTLEQAFFGREILNIVTGEGMDRVERHERHEAWATRFHRHGFSPFDVRHVGTELKESTNLSAPWGMISRPDALMLTWRDQPMLAASAWRPV